MTPEPTSPDPPQVGSPAEPRAAAASARAHFNPSRMNEIAEQAGSDRIVYELVSLFVEDVSARMTELEKAVLLGDSAQRERVAHSIKGSCANLGAELMAGMAHDIERCAADKAAQNLDGLRREFEKLCQTLRERYP